MSFDCGAFKEKKRDTLLSQVENCKQFHHVKEINEHAIN